MKIKSITQRWVLNSVSIIFAAMLILAVVLSASIKNFYYSAARQEITSKMNGISSVLLKTAEEDTVNSNLEIRSIVENSADKDTFEITAIDHNGKTALSSSGFSYIMQDNMPDYDQAVVSNDGMGYYVGKLTSGEKIMAVTMMIPYINADYSAIRYAISLEQIDKQLLGYTFLCFGAVLLILLLVIVSGFYFIKSIVMPIREIGVAARNFAAGDMSQRIVKKSNDEIGELCDIINYMADELSASEEVKNEFISSVSHELRTPLTAIKGWSETLTTLDSSETETIKKGMHVITNETERLSGMVEELLDFSRIQDGRLTLVKTNIDLIAELDEAVLIYAERAKRDGIELCYDEPDIAVQFFGDKNRLRQVFINVIDNALKYSDPGGKVTINVNQDADFISITVSDTGCGISKEDLPKVKTKFYKANLTRRGSGIGLAVANEIVLMHEGEIIIDSTLDVGTTVIIKLPVNLKKGQMRPTEISTTMEFSIAEEDKK